MTDLVMPTVNLNGTSAKALLRLNMTALEAVQLAIEELNQAAPHGRDYDRPTYSEARRQHDERLAKLDAVRIELEAICLHVHNCT
ncbi:MAG TPA: hypothetical protein VHY82_15965 [Acetobacteraceae bacterium]|jgi:hypothetical protein|nr:hypothetical protein [Acetobacteraceae bacterium]